MNQQKQPTKRHSGDLRADLIAAGIALIRDSGPTALSIRKVAARAGVSHAAPAHHFPHLSDLRCAIVAEGYRDFAAAMKAEIAKAGGDANAAVLAACHGYIHFACDNSGLFHLMFAADAYDYSSDECKHAAAGAYDVLRGVCAPFSTTEDDQQQTELLVWSVVHGFASLFLGNLSPTTPKGEAIKLFNTIFPKLPLGPT